jgi:UDP-N-acetylmuramoylalanine--D-glutamate ligase
MKALIIGMGKSGRGAARFLLHLGYEVVGVDQKPFEMEGVRHLEKEEIFDLVILSPGVPPEQAKGYDAIGEAELAFRHMKNRCIGITGTNGKTTLTLLITHVLNQGGIKARALGNVGSSLCEYLLSPDLDEVVVAELSSFQLETMTTPVFDYGVILNITPDHLDRYPSFEAYAKTKCRLEELVKEKLLISEEVARAFKSFFSEGKVELIPADSCLQLTKKERYWQIIGYDKALCAFAICKKFGITWDVFEKACQTFQKPEHRIEFVDEIGNVSFYNDSKGTNVEAVLYAISQLEGSIWLIAGGKSKGGSFMKWKTAFPGKVKEVFAIGETARQIEQELQESVTVSCFENLKEAVQNAYQKALKGDVVLLSPGCASFDQFSNYEERGRKFKECVLGLAHE